MTETVEKLSQWKIEVQRIGEEVSDEVWSTPIHSGKWSIREVTGHMLYWDRYLNKEGLPSILNKQTIVFPDHDEYNAQSVIYINNKSKSEIVKEAIEQRECLLSSLQSLSEDQWTKPISINGILADDKGSSNTLLSLMLDFAGHDRHHMNQIAGMEAVR